VPRFVNAELAAARQRQLGKQAPAAVLHCGARDISFLHLGHECLHIGTQQVKLMAIVAVRGMHADFRRRDAENQKAAAAIHAR
jgi:hypothetical protein